MALISRILAPADLEGSADAGIRYAGRLAADVGGTLVVAHVMSMQEVGVGDFSHRTEGVRDDAFHNAEEKLTEQVARTVDPSVTVETHLVYGDPVYEIGRLAQEEHCDILVVTVKNRSRVGKLMMGSKAQDLILSSPIPVLTVRRDEP